MAPGHSRPGRSRRSAARPAAPRASCVTFFRADRTTCVVIVCAAAHRRTRRYGHNLEERQGSPGRSGRSGLSDYPDLAVRCGATRRMAEIRQGIYTSAMALSIKSDEAGLPMAGRQRRSSATTILACRIDAADPQDPCRRHVGSRSGHPGRAGERRTRRASGRCPCPADACRHPCRAWHRHRGSAVACRTGCRRPIPPGREDRHRARRRGPGLPGSERLAAIRQGKASSRAEFRRLLHLRARRANRAPRAVYWS